MPTRALQAAIRMLRVCADLKPRERLLIVTDMNTDPTIPLTIAKAGTKLAAEVVIVTMRPRKLPGEEPPAPVTAAMCVSEVIICPTSTTLFHTKAKDLACKNGARLISMTGIVPSVLTSNAMLADFDRQKKVVERLAKHLTRAKRIRLTNPAGTDLTLNVTGREGHVVTGICRKPGDSTGVPDIEAYIAPLESSVNGRLTVDGSTSVTGIARNPLVLDIVQGRVKRIRGGTQATRLVGILRRTRSNNAFRVGEFGIGLNPLARIRGAIIEDEAALGTAHIALGDNHNFGGRNKAPTHVDMVVKSPRVELDGRTVLIGRRLLA